MFSSLCCSHQQKQKISPESIYYWFTDFRNSEFKQILSSPSPTSSKDFQGWTRIKVKSKNIEELAQQLKEDSMDFVDPDFTHQNISIVGDMHLLSQTKIEWKKAREIVPKGVFTADNRDFTHLEKYSCKNKALQTAFTLIARSHPRVLVRILTQTHALRGIYQFKLLKDGIIYNVMVDDFLPGSKNLPLFAGPTSRNQFYPMLLQKALAKVCGGYSNIPEDPLDIMDVIYCNMLTKEKLVNLKDVSEVNELIHDPLSNKKLTLLIPRKHKKVQQSGINPAQIYQIIQQHQLHIEKGQKIYEALSQNKLSSWNGPYSITDPQWKKVPQQQKEYIFKQMQRNHSFCLPDYEISNFFDQLLVYEDEQTLDKDWLVNVSETGYPSFSKFSIDKEGEIFLKISTSQYIRQRVILGKKNSDSSYEYIGAAFSQSSRHLCLQQKVQVGQYIIAVMHEWRERKEGEYVINLSSTNRAQLALQMRHMHNFLNSIFLSHSLKHNREGKEVFYSGIHEAGLGYLSICIRPPHKVSTIKINHEKIQNSDWEILQPHKQMKEMIITSDTLVGMQMLLNVPKQVSYFPIEAFVISTE